MTFQSGTGFTEIETDSGNATTTAAKPNIAIKGSGGASTSASGNEILVNAGSGGTGEVETFNNLGFSYDAGTGVFTIHSDDGTDLNSSNGFVRLWQSGGKIGLNKVYTIDQNYRFIDSNGTSQIDGNLFGKTSGDLWDEDMPMYVYAVSDSTNTDVWFAISRLPWFVETTEVQFLGSSSSTTANQESSFYFLQKWDGATWVDPTLSDYAQMPCRAIGNFLVQGSAADDWTVQSLTSSTTMGTLAFDRVYTMPTGVHGAGSGNYMFTSSGTPPTFATQNYEYYLSAQGFWWGNFEFSNITNGSTASATLLPIPFRFTGTNNDYLGNGTFINMSGTPRVTSLHFRGTTPQENFVTMATVSDNTTRVQIENGNWVTDSSSSVNGFLRSQVHRSATGAP